jgi:L-alanine-DL-glutamate epimerase-like enolase superfamily enzyme
MSIRSPKWLVLAALVVTTPDTPGVYELWDDDELLHVGATRESLRKELVHDELVFADGVLRPPERPGLGVELDPDALARFAAAAEQLVLA